MLFSCFFCTRIAIFISCGRVGETLSYLKQFLFSLPTPWWNRWSAAILTKYNWANCSLGHIYLFNLLPFFVLSYPPLSLKQKSHCQQWWITMQERMSRSLMVCQDKFEAAKLQQLKTGATTDLESCVDQAIQDSIQVLPHIVDRLKASLSLNSFSEQW